MKKFLSVLLLIAVLLSCCACGKETEAAQSSDELDVYANIDETVPVNGVYKIHSIKGLQNMAQHPDAKFELVRSIDLGGATLTAVGTDKAPFTGEFNGGNFTISNFTVKGSENVGFFGVLDGSVKNLNITGMTVIPTEETWRIGSLAGLMSGSVSRCSVSGTLVAEQAKGSAYCGGAVGTCAGKIQYSQFDVDVTYRAPGTAFVGGLAGCIIGGSITDCETSGRLDITDGSNSNPKNAGLLVGSYDGGELARCVFLGESNTIDGKLFTNFAGTQDEGTTVLECLRRDNSAEPLSANVQALRDKVEANMRAQGTVQWRVSEVLYHDCSCALAVCHGAFYPEKIYMGIPYNHKAGSLDRFMYCFDENMVAKDWIYDTLAFEGHDMYMGNDCSTSIQKAWLTVANSFTFTGASQEIPDRNLGTIPVGDWTWDLGKQAWYTVDYINATDEQVMYESYAKLRKGDAITFTNEEGGHTRMCASDAVVVRDEAGKIDPTYSYVLFHEQGAPVTWEPYYTTWRIDYKYTFANMRFEHCVPVTIEELLTGEMEPSEATLEGGVEGKAGLTTGTVKANYFLDSVTMVITDENGEEVFNHRMFSAVAKHEDHTNNSVFIRKVTYEYDLANFALPLRYIQFQEDGTYHCTVTANLATGDSFVVKDYTF